MAVESSITAALAIGGELKEDLLVHLTPLMSKTALFNRQVAPQETPNAYLLWTSYVLDVEIAILTSSAKLVVSDIVSVARLTVGTAEDNSVWNVVTITSAPHPGDHVLGSM